MSEATMLFRARLKKKGIFELVIGSSVFSVHTADLRRFAFNVQQFDEVYLRTTSGNRESIKIRKGPTAARIKEYLELVLESAEREERVGD